MQSVIRFFLMIVFMGAVCDVISQDRYHGLMFEKGMSGAGQSDWIMLLHYDLYYLGYGIYFDTYGGVTGEYQDQTVRAVKAFQSDHGMITDGVVAKKTTIAIERALENSELAQQWKSFNPMRYKGQKLRNGDLDELCGKAVTQLKSDLTALSYSVNGDPSGVFGDETEKALKEFQEINLVPSTGMLDDRTVITLAEKICLHTAKQTIK